MEEFLLGRNMGSGTRTTRNRFTPNLYHRTGHRMLPKSFLQSCFESPCLGATEGTKPGATDERVCTFCRDARVPQGALCLIPGLILKIHQLRYWKHPAVFFLCAVTRGLCECHPNPCNCSWVTCAVGLQRSGGQEMVVHLPACYTLYGTVLFDLSYSSCANFSPLCRFSSSLLMGQQPFTVVLLAGHRVHKVLQSAASASSRNLFCSPPSSTAPKLHPAFEHQRDQHPKAGC